MSAKVIALPLMKTRADRNAPARVTIEHLPAIALALSPIALWDELLDYCRQFGCRGIAFVDMTDRASSPLMINGMFELPCPIETLRQDLTGAGRGAVLIDRATLGVPAFGPRGLEAALVISLAGTGSAIPDWADAVGPAFQLAYARLRQISPLRRADEVPLSEREREIMQWVVRGKSNSVIGVILGISSSTVDTYMRRIFRKFDVTDRTSAAMRAVAIGAIA